ncbi:MAG TPA: response regulator [Chitinophagales bacterium]|jgi:CheY-like chemotaxis protein|nr:response regulator [Chitinophagales bacterium]
MLSKKYIHILLIEDNMGDFLLTQEALKECNVDYVLHHFQEGTEALKYLNKQVPYQDAVMPDFVLLDLNMPKMSGLEVLQIIKNTPHLKKIPVIVLSTSYSDSDVETAYDLHANAYIPKPLDYDDFVHIIKVIEQFWGHVVKLPTHILP